MGWGEILRIIKQLSGFEEKKSSSSAL